MKNKRTYEALTAFISLIIIIGLVIGTGFLVVQIPGIENIFDANPIETPGDKTPNDKTPNDKTPGDTGPGSNAPGNLSISLDNVQLTNEDGYASNFVLYPNATVWFDIDNSPGDYSIKIVSNPRAKETFEFYTASGQLKSFYMFDNDLTKAFDITAQKDSFAIGCTFDDFAGMLSIVLNSDIAITSDVPTTNLLSLIITFDNSAVLVIDFSIGTYAYGLTITPSEVIF